MHPQLIEASITFAAAALLAFHTLGRGHRSQAKRLLLTLLFGMMTWALGVAAGRMPPGFPLSEHAAALTFLGTFVVPPAWFLLAAHWTRHPWFEQRPNGQLLIVAPSLLALGALLTNSSHGLFVAAPEAFAHRPPTDWAGPLFWLWFVCAYGLVAGGAWMYAAWSWRSSSGVARGRGLLVIAASMLPLLGNLAHVAGLLPIEHDPTPLMLGLTILILFAADWRYRLLDTVPVALRDVIEHLRDGVLLVGPAGRIADMNPAAERLLETRLRDVAGRTLVEAMAAQAVDRFDLDQGRFERQALEMLSGAQPGFEHHVESFSGRHYEVRGETVAGPLGEPAGFYLVLRDVTDQIRFDAVQRQSRRFESIASLAGGIVHEVNNPLAYVRANVNHVMSVMADLSQQGADAAPKAAEEVRAVLDETLEGIDRIGGIIDRIRRFTRTQGAARESICLAELLREAVRIGAQDRSSEVVLELDLEEGVPSVFGIRDGLLQAVMNLIENAEEAVQAAGGRIRVALRRGDETVRIEIEDDGPGIPAELHDRIFEPFFTTGEAEAGRGLGLALGVKLVADSGGTIGVEDREGGGSRFIVRLPGCGARNVPGT